MSAPTITRAFDAIVDDVSKDQTVVARVNCKSLDRFNSVIDPKGGKLDNFRKNPICLWEHGKDIRRQSDPIGRCAWIRHDGGPQPTEILAKTRFLADEFSRQRYEWYRDGVLNSFSIRALPLEWGRPTRDEVRAMPELDNDRPNDTRGAFDGPIVYRSWELAEYSGVACAGNADCIVVERAMRMLDLERRDLLWLPEDVRPIVEAASRTATVIMPGLPDAGSRDVPIVPGGVPILSDVVADPANAPYGYCPECGARGVERRPDGDDACENGHVYPADAAAGRAMTDSVGGLAGGGAAVRPDDGDDDDDEEEETDEHGKPRKKAKAKGGEPPAKSSVGAPQPVSKSAADAPASIARRIRKKGGKYFVRSEDGAGDMGGPYDTEAEAAHRLGQVESLKHKDEGEGEGEPRTAPYVDADGATCTVRRPDGSAIAVYRDAADAEECLRMIDGQGRDRPDGSYEHVLARALIEQRSAIDARQDDLMARFELEYFGRLGTDRTPARK